MELLYEGSVIGGGFLIKYAVLVPLGHHRSETIEAGGNAGIWNR